MSKKMENDYIFVQTSCIIIKNNFFVSILFFFDMVFILKLKGGVEVNGVIPNRYIIIILEIIK